MPGEADLRVAGLDRGGERVAALVRLCEKCAGRPGWSARVRNAIARDRQSLTITEVDGRPEKKDGDA
jgi:hypothetical protein